MALALAPVGVHLCFPAFAFASSSETVKHHDKSLDGEGTTHPMCRGRKRAESFLDAFEKHPKKERLKYTCACGISSCPCTPSTRPRRTPPRTPPGKKIQKHKEKDTELASVLSVAFTPLFILIIADDQHAHVVPALRPPQLRHRRRPDDGRRGRLLVRWRRGLCLRRCRRRTSRLHLRRRRCLLLHHPIHQQTNPLAASYHNEKMQKEKKEPSQRAERVGHVPAPLPHHREDTLLLLLAPCGR